MSHLDSGVLHELIDGEIPSSQLGPLQAHLAGCAACRSRLDHERELVAGADELIEALDAPATTAPPSAVRVAPRRPRFTSRDLAWAASVVVAAGLGFALRQPAATALDNRPLPASPTVAAVNPPPASVGAPAATAQPQTGRPEALAAKASEPTASNTHVPLAVDAVKRRADEPARERFDTTAISQNVAKSVGRVAADASREPPLAGSMGGSARLDEARPASAPAPQLAVRGMARVDSISLPDAVQRLGGTLRLIDGLVPLRLEWQTPYVRVVYPGEIVLRQQAVDGHLMFEVLGPRGVTADSLARLRAKVRE